MDHKKHTSPTWHKATRITSLPDSAISLVEGGRAIDLAIKKGMSPFQHIHFSSFYLRPSAISAFSYFVCESYIHFNLSFCRDALALYYYVKYVTIHEILLLLSNHYIYLFIWVLTNISLASVFFLLFSRQMLGEKVLSKVLR